MKRKIKWGVGLLTLISGVAVGIKALDTRLMIRHYDYYHPAVTEAVKLIVLSDLHSNHYGENQEKLIGLIKEQKPNVVLLVGDIVDDILPIEYAQEFLVQIAKLYPVYYVTGNHEYYTRKGEAIKQMIQSYGITVLSGETVPFSYYDTHLQVSGIDDPLFEDITFQLMNAAQTQKTIPSVKILLAHRPEHIEEYLNFDFDIILSGHAHGGQWRIPGIINGVYAPGQGIFPKYAGGHYDMGTTQFYVSRGLETQKNTVPRIFNPPEIVVLNILKEKN